MIRGCELTMKKIVFVLCLIMVASILSLPSLSMAQSYPHCSFGMDEGDPIPLIHFNPLLVYLVYDEEVSYRTYDWFGETLNGREYVRRETLRGLYHFPFGSSIIFIDSFMSTNSFNIVETLTEAEQRFRWGFSPLVAKVLIVWTGQDNDAWGGYADITKAAVIIKTDVCWIQDNQVQHELSHVLNVYSHCNDVNCVMSYLVQDFVWTVESLQPIYSWVEFIPLNSKEYTAHISNSWCPTDYSLLLQSNGFPYAITNASTDMLLEPSPERLTKNLSVSNLQLNDPDPKRYSEPGTELYWIIIGLTIVSTVALILWKRRKTFKRIIYSKSTPKPSYSISVQE